MSLGEFLKHIRMLHGLNQTELGNMCFRTKDYIYLIENGKAKPTSEELYLISEKLEEPILKLITYGMVAEQLLDLKLK